jgi:hypothetical protein
MVDQKESYWEHQKADQKGAQMEHQKAYHWARWKADQMIRK